MKKQLLIVLSTVLVVIVLSLTGCTKPLPSFEEGVEAGCFDAGGLMGPEGCVPQEPVIETVEIERFIEIPVTEIVEIPVIQEKIIEVVVTPTPQPQEGLDPRCPYTVHFGDAGDFFSEWDSKLETCVVGMYENARVSGTTGIPLWQIKEDGLTYSFTMPFKGYLNHSASAVYLNEQLVCTPGNPVRCGDQSLFEAGTTFKISTLAGNNSAGSFLIQVTP